MPFAGCAGGLCRDHPAQDLVRRVGLVEKGLSAGRIGDDVLDQRRLASGERELGVADPERIVLDQHVLIFAGAVALIMHLGAKARDVRDRDLERLVVGVFSGPVARIQRRIDRHIGGLGRHGQPDRLVVRRDGGQNIGHGLLLPHRLHGDQPRPDRPAARLQLMSISDFSFAGSGLICISTVCFITNTPILAMFWRTSTGC